MPEEKQGKTEGKKLSNTTIWLMIAVAAFYDTLQALLDFLGAGILITPVFHMTFWLWFEMKGLKFYSMKRAKLIGIGAIIELIPFFDLLPTFTMTIVRVTADYKIKKTISG